MIAILSTILLSIFATNPCIKILKSEFIYQTAPFPSCHASTLVETDEGILASWFGGTYEKHPDVSIYTARLQDDKWTTPVMVADGVKDDNTRFPTWNPVLYKKDDGKVVLYYKIGPSPSEWWGVYKTSNDEGKSWSNEIAIPDDLLGPIKNKPVRLPNGNILYPTSYETDDLWHAYVETSDQSLNNWNKTDIDNGGFNAIQPTILFHPEGKIQMLLRTQEGEIATTWSSNQGENWTPLQATNLVNNNSGIDGVTLKNGYQLLVVNPIKEGRNKLSLLGSEDGINWNELYVLENEPKGEFSYPAIIQAEDGKVHITYTYNREKIKYVSLLLD